MKTIQLLIIFCTLALQAQVGINTETPNQMLSVNGKVELADDAVAPTEGTMRFNATETDFEGYAGGAWQSMTGRSFFPKNAIPYFGYASGILPGTVENIIFRNAANGSGYFTTVPAGKFMIVTSVTFRPNALFSSDPAQYLSIGPKLNTATYPDYQRTLLIGVKAHQINRLAGENGFLFIVRPGENLAISNQATSTQNWEARVTGFLVDDLDFN